MHTQRLIPLLAVIVGCVFVAGCDNATYYNTTIQGVAVPEIAKGTPVVVALKDSASEDLDSALVTGSVVGQSGGWLVIETNAGRKMISPSSIAWVDFPKPASPAVPNPPNN